MKRLPLFLSLGILLICCNTSNQTEKDYIKNLEEKNRLLEQEISNLKNTTIYDEADNSKEVNDNVYFTIGSSEKEVIEVMGTPTGYNDNGRFGKVLWYGLSTVNLKNGKVTGYDDLGGNLKVRIVE